jgi:hypothetical protein
MVPDEYSRFDDQHLFHYLSVTFTLLRSATALVLILLAF